MSEITLPDFLKNRSFEEILQEMFDVLPEDIDKCEGGFTWDFTAPTALVVARMYEQVLPSLFGLIWPEFSYGEYLDYHAKTRGMRRRSAVAATGYIKITGEVGTFIPKGYKVCDASINDIPSVDYVTTEEAEIPDSGSVIIPIECTQVGTVGNAPANTIVIPVTKLQGIKSITNEEAVEGGVEIESDDLLRQRIMEADLLGRSLVGNVADYKRWATSVSGVGNATIIPAQDESGIVTIILTDYEGKPASDSLRDDVYNYIMQPEYPLERLAPPNAVLNIISPTLQPISITATVELKDWANLDSIKAKFLLALESYMYTAVEDGEVKYTKIGAILSSLDGLNDFDYLTIDGGTENITITSYTIPVVYDENVTLTSGEVS